ncbi:MAG: AsmA family protein [Blastochloris sp.]|nr:AsmA family protein [Blastochloris sp.]
MLGCFHAEKILLGLAILAVLILVALVAGFFFVMNQLNSPGFAESIRQGIKDKFGAEVQFSGHRIGLGSASLQKLTIPNPSVPQGENLLSADLIELDFSLLSIFQGNPTVSKLIITQPVLKLRQRKEGGLILPIDLAQLQAKLTEASANPGPVEAGTQLPLSISNLKLLGAAVEVYADDGSVLFKAENANFNGSFTQTLSERSAQGDLTIAKLFITPGIQASEAKSPLVFEKNILRLTQLTAKLYGGDFAGEASLDTQASPMTYQTTAQVTGADLSPFMADLGSDANTILGKATMDFKGGGDFAQPKELVGAGTLSVSEFQVPKLQSLKAVGLTLGITALQEGKFDSLQSTYKIAGQKVILEPLNVNSPNLNIVMNGPIGFDKSIQLLGTLSVDPGSLQLANTLLSSANLSSSSVTRMNLPITVTGMANDPKVRVDMSGMDPIQSHRRGQRSSRRLPQTQERRSCPRHGTSGR